MKQSTKKNYQIPPLIENVQLDIRKNLFFQRYGALTYNAITVRQYLNSTFENRRQGLMNRFDTT